MMRRRWARVALVFLGLLLVAAAAAAVLVPPHAKKQAGRLFSRLAVCLAGPERLEADEAAVRARRLHPKGGSAALARCAEAADEMARSRWVRLSSKLLALHAENAALELRSGRLPEISALWSEARELPWDPPSGAATPSPPEPLLDRALPELRTRRLGYELKSKSEEFQPYDRTILGGRSSVCLVLRPDAQGKPFRVAAWERASRPRAGWNISDENGRVSAMRQGTEKAIDLGAGDSAADVGDYVVWMRGSELHARRLDEDGSVGPDLALMLAGGAGHRWFKSCRLARGRVITASTGTTISVVLLDATGLAHWGSLASKSVGQFTLGCDESHARLGGAISEPGGELVDNEVPKNNAHRIVAAECTRAGCVSRESRVTGIEAGWYSLGGYGAAWAMSAPTVIHLGSRMLVLWVASRSVNYRFAPLDELERTPTKWLAELSRPDRSAEGSRADTERQAGERNVAWPELNWHLRDKSALVAVNETIGDGAAFLARFHDDGEVSAVVPPPLPP